jgi:hypothetical protein
MHARHLKIPPLVMNFLQEEEEEGLSAAALCSTASSSSAWFNRRVGWIL